ncbi:hypothetical protein BH09ACT1_BH09ACT1_20780 [soil metagenome]
MLRFARFLMYPVMRSWVGALADTTEGFPQPGLTGRIVVDGDDLVTILLIGGGRAAGYGVLDHDMGFIGCMARALSTSLDRGVAIDSVTSVRMTAARALEAVENVDVTGYDAIVLIIGTYDLVALTPARAFGARMESLVAGLACDESGRTLFVGEIPALPTVTGIKGMPVALAKAHRPALTAQLEEVLRRHPSTVSLPLSDPAHADVTDRSMSKRYLEWGNEAAVTIAAHLVGRG